MASNMLCLAQCTIHASNPQTAIKNSAHLFCSTSVTEICRLRQDLGLNSVGRRHKRKVLYPPDDLLNNRIERITKAEIGIQLDCRYANESSAKSSLQGCTASDSASMFGFFFCGFAVKFLLRYGFGFDPGSEGPPALMLTTSYKKVQRTKRYFSKNTVLPERSRCSVTGTNGLIRKQHRNSFPSM